LLLSVPTTFPEPSGFNALKSTVNEWFGIALVLLKVSVFPLMSTCPRAGAVHYGPVLTVPPPHDVDMPSSSAPTAGHDASAALET
jgi:hypothetical protein